MRLLPTRDEDDNGLELDEEGYEEFNSIIFDKGDGTYFEVNYHNLPDEIYHEGKLILKKEKGVLKHQSDA